MKLKDRVEGLHSEIIRLRFEQRQALIDDKERLLKDLKHHVTLQNQICDIQKLVIEFFHTFSSKVGIELSEDFQRKMRLLTSNYMMNAEGQRELKVIKDGE